MTRSIDRGPGRASLLLAHCAGMIDLVAMPVWVETLIRDYDLGPQRAGALVSLFLLAAVAASVLLASKMNRVSAAKTAMAGYAIAALAFAGSALTRDFGVLALLYLIGGAAVGTGLSCVHGTIGRSVNPHRLFAIAGTAAGVMSIGFYGAMVVLTRHFGPAALFWLIAGIMAAAAVVNLLAFPSAAAPARAIAAAAAKPFSPLVWLGIFGVSGMALSQAIGASFLQHVGLGRDFGDARVNAVLLTLAFLTIFPGALAALLQRRLPVRWVVISGPFVQMLIVVVMSHSLSFWPYALAGVWLTSVQIFVQTFAFGLIARLDPSGRAVAATPATIMTGSALGPFLAGSLVALSGFESLGYAVAVISVIAAWCFYRATRSEAAGSSATVAALAPKS